MWSLAHSVTIATEMRMGKNTKRTKKIVSLHCLLRFKS